MMFSGFIAQDSALLLPNSIVYGRQTIDNSVAVDRQ